MLVGLGSNRCHGRHGPPGSVLRAAIRRLGEGGLKVKYVSPVIETAPLGPSDRRFANAALKGSWAGGPTALLKLLKTVEREYGRRPGRRWGARVLDCDLLAFGDRIIDMPDLKVPHPRLHERDFVLRPLLAVAPGWRHPILHLSVRHMAARLAKPRPQTTLAVDPPRASF